MQKCTACFSSSREITTPQHRNETVMWFGRSNKSKPSHAWWEKCEYGFNILRCFRVFKYWRDLKHGTEMRRSESRVDMARKHGRHNPHYLCEMMKENYASASASVISDIVHARSRFSKFQKQGEDGYSVYGHPTDGSETARFGFVSRHGKTTNMTWAILP